MYYYYYIHLIANYHTTPVNEPLTAIRKAFSHTQLAAEVFIKMVAILLHLCIFKAENVCFS